MVDPLVVSVASAAKAVDATSAESVKVAGNLFTRLLGPLADEMGARLAEKYRMGNVQKVVERAASKVALADNGAVPARVAAAVFDAAQWAEEEFVTEYLSGVLAAARTPEGRDDSAVAWTALVGRMSTSAIKMHYAIYSAIHALVAGQEISTLNQIIDRDLYVSGDAAMNVIGDRTDGTLLEEALHLLNAENLLNTQAWGPVNYLGQKYRREFPETGVVLRMTPRGILLILQAFGHAQPDTLEITRGELVLKLDESERDDVPQLPVSWVDSLPEKAQGWTLV
ncbi:hypothetical protein [Curtobacterium sp. MCJR17_020]|uniref:hypothetical protein n=1 Tax=Curtobacterium sp. MCJR17_020 TaxID=2175619 RepID=UPI0011B558BD|nr:hypothetical protein [Curtobacterium sp. MCJR17_020]WIE72353.1 hypothetical protein DEJ14_000940 [Curtobacterium sp. MCJR17_020]